MLGMPEVPAIPLPTPPAHALSVPPRRPLRPDDFGALPIRSDAEARRARLRGAMLGPGQPFSTRGAGPIRGTGEPPLDHPPAR